MKKAIFILAILILGSCGERYYNGGEVKHDDSFPFKVREFEVDHCKYFAVYQWEHSMTALQVKHKANCPNH